MSSAREQLPLIKGEIHILCILCTLLKEQRALEGKFVMGILVFLSLFLTWYVLWDLFLSYSVLRINGIVFRASHHGKQVVEHAVCLCVSSQVRHARLTAEQSHRSFPPTAFSIPVPSTPYVRVTNELPALGHGRF